MATGVQKAWSVTASSNGNADASINLAEGQTPASLNDAGRAVMAGVKGFANQISAAKTTGGAANVQTLTSDSVAAISTAYAAGMIFCVKAGYTNSTTTPTLNVDGVGAKTIKKGGAQAALAAGDITAGGIYWLAYEASGDCFLLLNPDSGSISSQPLDATLTALAALSWSSGSPLVQFTAADTVSLTLAPSVTSLTASGGVTANGANAFTAYRSGDAARIRVVEATNNNVWAWRNNANIASWDYNGTDSLLLEASAALYPASNDGLALGKASLSYSDLFLASGAVINFNNSNYTLTHSTGALEASGTFRARVPRSSEAGTPTSASANKKMLLTGGATIDSGTADDFYLMDPGTSARTITRGSGMTMYVNGADSATATLAANQMGAVHYRSSTVVVLTGAFS